MIYVFSACVVFQRRGGVAHACSASFQSQGDETVHGLRTREGNIRKLPGRKERSMTIAGPGRPSDRAGKLWLHTMLKSWRTMTHDNGPTWCLLSEAATASGTVLAFSSLRSKPSRRRKTILRGGAPGNRRLPTKLPPEEKLNTLRT